MIGDEILFTAHSGCDGTTMNSAEYIQHAITKPFNYIEVDVRRNQNGVLVLRHDADLTGNELTVEEAVKLVKPFDKSINFDLKEYNLEEDIINICESLGFDQRRIGFSGSLTHPETFRSEHVRITVFINPEELIPDFYNKISLENMALAYEYAIIAKEYGYEYLNVNYQVATPEFITFCSDADLKISAWTVDDKNVFDFLQARFIGNITTNHSEFIVKLSN